MWCISKEVLWDHACYHNVRKLYKKTGADRGSAENASSGPFGAAQHNSSQGAEYWWHISCLCYRGKWNDLASLKYRGTDHGKAETHNRGDWNGLGFVLERSWGAPTVALAMLVCGPVVVMEALGTLLNSLGFSQSGYFFTAGLFHQTTP